MARESRRARCRRWLLVLVVVFVALVETALVVGERSSRRRRLRRGASCLKA
jgi:hypothetical protein